MPPLGNVTIILNVPGTGTKPLTLKYIFNNKDYWSIQLSLSRCWWGMMLLQHRDDCGLRKIYLTTRNIVEFDSLKYVWGETPDPPPHTSLISSHLTGPSCPRGWAQSQLTLRAQHDDGLPCCQARQEEEICRFSHTGAKISYIVVWE